MPKTIFALVTILFGVISGNRLMDNRLLRSSSAFPSMAPYNSYSDKMKIFKLKTLQKTAKPVDFPYGSSLDVDHDLTIRHCNGSAVDLFKNANNYLSYENDADSIRENNAHKSYQSMRELDDDDVLEGESESPKKFLKNMKIFQSKLNPFPVANYKDFYDDLVTETAKDELSKRNGNALATVFGSPPPRGCDCKIRNDLMDLGQQHFPRYLLNAICHTEHSRNDLGPKCWSGSVCRPLEYKVKVLTFRTLMDNMQKDPTLAWLPDDLRPIWKFRTVTVTAGCFCS